MTKLTNLQDLFEDVESEVIRRISVDLIDVDPNQPRKKITQASIEEMGNTLASEGQLQPILVTEGSNGRYLILIGERRYRGAKWKGIPELKAIVVDKIDTKKRLRQQLIENLQREEMNAMDTAEAIAILIQQEGSAVAAGIAIGKSEGQISKYMSLLNLAPMASELAKSQITRDVETLTTVSKIERSDKQAAALLISEAKQKGKLSRDSARDVAKAVSEKLKTKNNMQSLIKDKKSPKAIVTTAAEMVRPIRVKDKEQLSITVSILDSSREAKRFAHAFSEHGEARLYLDGVSTKPHRCWVLFGNTPRSSKSDQYPRLQEFDCKNLLLGWVTKFKPE